MLEQEQKNIVYKDKESPIEGSIEEKLTPSGVSIGTHTLYWREWFLVQLQDVSKFFTDWGVESHLHQSRYIK